MKLGFQILILMVFCFSCKDEKVFDSSPSERNANHIGELRKGTCKMLLMAGLSPIFPERILYCLQM